MGEREPRWERALITGASSGIGEAMARYLAAEGTDLVLLARRTDRLEALAGELAGERAGEPDIEVQVVTADLATGAGRRTAIDRLVSEDDPVDLAIANAGISAVEEVAEGDWERAARMIDINVVAVAQMVYAASALFKGRGRGGILLTSSTASFQPIPGSATYAATKAFVTSLAESVHHELRGTDVQVCALCPGPTETEILGDDSMGGVPDLLVTSAEEVARAGINGLAAGRAFVVPGLTNKAARLLGTLVPRSVTRTISGSMYNRFAPD